MTSFIPFDVQNCVASWHQLQQVSDHSRTGMRKGMYSDNPSVIIQKSKCEKMRQNQLKIINVVGGLAGSLLVLTVKLTSFMLLLCFLIATVDERFPQKLWPSSWHLQSWWLAWDHVTTFILYIIELPLFWTFWRWWIWIWRKNFKWYYIKRIWNLLLFNKT